MEKQLFDKNPFNHYNYDVLVIYDVVENRTFGGTTMKAYGVPVTDESVEEETVVADISHHLPGSVIAIDDDALQLEVIKEMLERNGVSCVNAVSCGGVCGKCRPRFPYPYRSVYSHRFGRYGRGIFGGKAGGRINKRSLRRSDYPCFAGGIMRLFPRKRKSACPCAPSPCGGACPFAGRIHCGRQKADQSGLDQENCKEKINEK